MAWTDTGRKNEGHVSSGLTVQASPTIPAAQLATLVTLLNALSAAAVL